MSKISGQSLRFYRYVVGLALIHSLAVFSACAPHEEHSACAPHEAHVYYQGPTTVTFKNYPDIKKGLETFARQIVDIKKAQEAPLFGGVEAVVQPYYNIRFHSAPFGTCAYNNITAGFLYTSQTGKPFRVRSSQNHTFAEIFTESGWFVLDVHSDDRFIKTGSNTPVPFYKLSELENDGKNLNPAVYKEGKSGFSSLYENVVPFDGKEISVVNGWMPPEIKLNKYETAYYENAGINLFDLHSYSNRVATDERPRRDFPIRDGNRPLKRFRIQTPLVWSKSPAKIEHPFFIYSAGLYSGNPKSSEGWLALNGSIRLFPATPSWAKSITSLPARAQEGGAAPLNDGASIPKGGVIDHPKWNNGWKLLDGAAYYFDDKIVVGSGGATFRYESDYKNTKDHEQYIWIPLVYRAHNRVNGSGVSMWFTKNAGDGGADRRRINIRAFSENLSYADVVLVLTKDNSPSITLDVPHGSGVDIIALGKPMDISGILSPSNPVLALEVDTSGLPPAFDDIPHQFLEYNLLVNETLQPKSGN